MQSSLNRSVQLRLLGEFDIAVAHTSGRPSITYAKPKLLLAVLALAQGKPYTRAELADMLWPDDLKGGRGNLRHALFMLRRVLSAVPDAWVSTSSTLALNPEIMLVDVLALIGDPTYGTLTLEQRLAYDRGRLLEYVDLPESAVFTAWKTNWQTRIERDVAQCRTASLAELIASGNLNQAVASAKQWVHSHPEDESAHRQLIQLLLEHGDREAAVLAYQHCVSIMRERCDTEPSEQTRGLIEHVLSVAEPDVFRSTELQQYRPLAVLAVTLSIDESQSDFPDQLLQDLHAARKALQELARSEGGHVLLGADDSLAIVFGYPKSSERPAHAAAKLSIAIQARSLSRDVRLGMGLHADIALVQSNARPDAGALISQHAMRLAYLAETGEVLISASARNRLTDQFAIRSEKRHGRQLRVLEAPLDSKMVRRMFGRVREFDSLVRLWAHLPIATAPTAMILRGEAGIGKSLLTRVMAEYVRHTGGDVCVLYCDEGHGNTPFYSIREYIMQRLALEWGGLLPAQDAADYQRRLVGMICQRLGLDISVQENLQRVLFPESRHASRQPTINASNRSALLHALIGVVTYRTQPGRPLLLVWEDMHWADHPSLALLDTLMTQVQAAPTMVLVTAREEFACTWPTHELSLKPLERQAVAELVAYQSKGERLPPKLRAHIVDEADGIPLYAEEMVRQAVLGAEIGIAPVIADLISARLSYLEAATRRLVQFAAVAGRVDEKLMVDVSQDAGWHAQDLPDMLRELRQHGLIDEGGSANFRHALVRDAIYHTLSAGQRRRQHERVALGLIKRAEKSEPVESAYIALHLEMAQHTEAAQWWCNAARDALAQSAVSEAQTLTERALGALRYIADVKERRRIELEAQLMRGSVFTSLKGGGAAETMDAYQRTVALQQSDGDTNTQFLMLWGAWAMSLSTVAHAETLQHAERLHRYAEQTNDEGLLSWSRYACGFSHLLTCDMVAAERWLRASIQGMKGRPDHSLRFARWGADCVCASKAMLGWVLTLQGRQNEGLISAQAGLADADGLDHLASRVICLAMLGEIHRQCGDDDQALLAADTLRSVANSGDFALWRGLAEGLAGWVRARRGERNAVGLIERAIDASRAGMPVLQSILELFLANSYLLHNEVELAEQAICRSGEVMHRFGSHFIQGDYLCLLGRVAAHQQQYDRARECWQEALSESRRLGLSLAARRAEVLLRTIPARKVACVGSTDCE